MYIPLFEIYLMQTIPPFTKSDMYPGYYMIEGYPRNAINRAGDVINLATGEQCKIELDKDARWSTSIYSEHNGKWLPVKRYRLLMIALSDRPANYRELTVNHRNFNTLDDELSNLEWMTARENIQEAVDRGAYAKMGTTDTPVEVKEIATGAVTRFSSKKKATEYMGVSMDCLKTALNDRAQPSIRGRWLARLIGADEGINRVAAVHRAGLAVHNLTDNTLTIYPSMMSFVRDKLVSKADVSRWIATGSEVVIDGKVYRFDPTVTPWRVIEDPQAELLRYGPAQTVILRDVVSGVDTEYTSVTALAEANGWGVSTVSIWLSEPGQLLKLKRYQVKFKKDNVPWREITDLIAEQRASGCARMVRVTESDGTVRDFMSAKAASIHYGILATTANWRLKSAGGKVYADGTRWEYQ